MWERIKKIEDKHLWVLFAIIVTIVFLHHHPDVKLQEQLDQLQAITARIEAIVQSCGCIPTGEAEYKE